MQKSQELQQRFDDLTNHTFEITAQMENHTGVTMVAKAGEEIKEALANLQGISDKNGANALVRAASNLPLVGGYVDKAYSKSETAKLHKKTVTEATREIFQMMEEKKSDLYNTMTHMKGVFQLLSHSYSEYDELLNAARAALAEHEAKGEDIDVTDAMERGELRNLVTITQDAALSVQQNIAQLQHVIQAGGAAVMQVQKVIPTLRNQLNQAASISIGLRTVMDFNKTLGSLVDTVNEIDQKNSENVKEALSEMAGLVHMSGNVKQITNRQENMRHMIEHANKELKQARERQSESILVQAEALTQGGVLLERQTKEHGMLSHMASESEKVSK